MEKPKLTKEDVMPMLLAASPGFETAWKAHLALWGEDEAGIFNDATEFAGYLIDCYAAGNTSEFGSVFATIERLILDGNDEARGAATVGVLESLQTMSSHYPFGPGAFEPWLGERSLAAWNEIAELWRRGGGSLMGVIRNEVDAQRKRWWQFWK